MIEGYKVYLRIRRHTNPERHGLKRPRNPVLIFKHAVKGMLPMDKPHGREAYKRLRVFIGLPSEFSNIELTRFPDAMSTRLRGRFVTVEEVAKALGWKGVEK